MELDDILNRITGLAPADKKQVIDDAYAATKDLAFIPSPGPQTDAYFSEADVVLFGGSPGGGKTALEVGLALNCHRRALIVRKNFVDLAGVLHTLDNILGKEGSAVGGMRPVYRKPGGGVIDFMGLGENIDGKQGNPHDLLCVGKGTPVLMGDATYKAVEDVSPGDYVMTLEGPRVVQKTYGPMYKKAACISAHGFKQIQSRQHELLTPSGWVSAASLLSGSCEPTGCCAQSTSSSQSWPKSPGPSTPHALLAWGLQQAGGAVTAALRWAEAGWLAFASRMEQLGRGSASAEYGGSTQRTPRPALSSGLLRGLRLPLRALGVAMRSAHHFVFGCDVCGAPKRSSLPDSKGDCSTYSRPCDVRTHAAVDRCSAQEGVRLYLHQPNDAGLPNPTYSQVGDPAENPRCNHRKPAYAHPYTGGARQASEDVQLHFACVSPLGVEELYDLQVHEVNHYITAGGFINRNCIDEAAQIPESQVRMLMGWLRTDEPGQRCRVVMGSNPPLNSTGDWLIGYFAPWLDPQHPKPAQEGELRYFLPNEDGIGDRECEADDFMLMEGVRVAPQSRTFISSKFTDNPYYDAEQYAKSLAGLPDSARQILMSGNFLLNRPDDIYQTIPTAWVRAAQARWTSTPPVGVPQCAIGVDIAQGGSDQTVLAKRHDGWYAPLVAIPGKDTPDGKVAAGVVISHRRDNSRVIVDIGGGWGGDCYAHLKANNVDCRSYMGVKTTNARTADKQLKFFNVRAEAYWRFREALDPSQDGGSSICLPPDAELLADLCAPTYGVGANGIKIEAKDQVCDRIKRSTDKGDAVVMAWWDGLKQENVQGGWSAHRAPPRVVMGHQQARR